MGRDLTISSNIASIGYDDASDVLEVEFKHGAVYQYYGVPQSLHENLMQQQSKGKFFNTYIKNAYPYSRV